MTRLTLVLLGCLWTLGCGPGVDPATLPAVPRVDISGYQPAVRAQLERALEHVDKKPASADANGELGKLYRVYRNLEAAEVLLRRARALAPRNVDWTYLHGEVLEQLADNQGALAAMDAVLAREPDNVPAQLRAARMRQALGDVQSAIARLSRLVTSAPDHGDVYTAYAQALMLDGKPQEAIRVWHDAIRQFGGYKTAHYSLAQLYRRQGDTERAAEHLWLFEVIGITDPPPVDSRLAQLFRLDQSDRALVRQAQAAKRAGDAARTVSLLEQAVALNPDNMEVRAALILAYTEQADFASAAAHGQAGSARDPHHAQLGLALGRMHLRQGKMDTAIEHLTNVVSRSPNHAAGLAWLGRVRMLRGDVAQAGADLRAAIAIEPGQKTARRFYAAWLGSHATPEQAIVELGGLAATPALDVPLILLARAQIQARAGSPGDAIKSLDRGVAIARLHKQERVVTKLVNQRQRLALAQP